MSPSPFSSRNGDESIDNEKESYVISLNEYFETLELNSYLNVTRNTYWDSTSNTNYSVSVSKNFDIGDFKGISASLAVTVESAGMTTKERINITLSSLYLYNKTATSPTVCSEREAVILRQMISWYDSSESQQYLWNISSVGNGRQST